jgi:hypothetical protein
MRKVTIVLSTFEVESLIEATVKANDYIREHPYQKWSLTGRRMYNTGARDSERLRKLHVKLCESLN